MCAAGGAGGSVLSAGASASLSIRKAHGAEVCKFAVLVIALCSVEPQAKRLVAVPKLQILHGFGECGDLPVLLKASLHLPAFLAIAFAALVAFAWTFGSVRASAGLEQCMDVCSNAGHLVQHFVQSPPFAVETGYLAPQFAVCVEQFMCVDRAETGVRREALRAYGLGVRLRRGRWHCGKFAARVQARQGSGVRARC